MAAYDMTKLCHDLSVRLQDVAEKQVPRKAETDSKYITAT